MQNEHTIENNEHTIENEDGEAHRQLRLSFRAGVLIAMAITMTTACNVVLNDHKLGRGLRTISPPSEFEAIQDDQKSAALRKGGPAPLQYFYDETTMTQQLKWSNGCAVKVWRPISADPLGMTAPPFVTTVGCEDDEAWSATGALPVGGGAVMIYNTGGGGGVLVNGENLTALGDAYWAQDSSAIDISLSPGSHIVAVGGDFERAFDDDTRRTAAQVISGSYAGPTARSYMIKDALAGARTGRNVNDTHINEGRASARDLTWASRTGVEPAHLVVLNCQNDTWVRDHVHPFGALYVPLTGRICFDVAGDARCVAPGEPRWTSPLLRYPETFHVAPQGQPDVAATEAKALVDDAFARAGMVCELDAPITFAVTNFDAGSGDAGVPNFDYVPDPSRPMTVHSTQVRSVTLDWPDSII